MSRPTDRGPQEGKIFIGGLNANVTKEQVEEFLAPHKPHTVWCVSRCADLNVITSEQSS
jgi:hypothetical protein